MIDLLVHGKNGQKAYLDLPVPLKALQKAKDRLGETEWTGWNIRYVQTDADGIHGVNIVLYNNLAGYGRTDDVRELNLLAYVLDRMNESQRETFEMNFHGLGISTCVLRHWMRSVMSKISLGRVVNVTIGTKYTD